MTWSVESYQLVFFHQPHLVQDAFTIWLQLFQSTPDNYQRNSDVNTGASQASGKSAGFDWQVVVAPGRFDIFVVGSGQPTVAFPVLSSDAAALAFLIAKSRQLALGGLGVYRLAFGTQMTSDCSSIEEANTRFGSLTHTSVPAVGTLDLVLSFNRRKTLPKTNYEVNRLCRWQAVEKQLMHVDIMNGRAMTPSATQPAVLLNIDINTLPQQAPLNLSAIPLIVDELVESSRELREGGYDAYFVE